MRTIRALLAVLLLLSSSAPAAPADFKYSETSQVTGGALFGMAKFAAVFARRDAKKREQQALQPTTPTHYLKDTRLRPDNSDGAAQIINLDGRRVVLSQPTTKTKVLMDLAMQATATRPNAPPPGQSNSAKMTYTMNMDTFVAKGVSGHQEFAQFYREQNQQAAKPPSSNSSSSSDNASIDNPSSAMMKGLGHLFGKKKQEDSPAASNQVSAPPLNLSPNPNSLMEITTQVNSISDSSLDGRLFDILAGFTEIQGDPSRVFGGWSSQQQQRPPKN